MTSIFEGQPPQNKAFPIKSKGHLGSRYIYPNNQDYFHSSTGSIVLKLWETEAGKAGASSDPPKKSETMHKF